MTKTWQAKLGDGRTIEMVRREPHEHLHFWQAWDRQGRKWILEDRQMTEIENGPRTTETKVP